MTADHQYPSIKLYRENITVFTTTARKKFCSALRFCARWATKEELNPDDTGASCTAISRKRLFELGSDENWIKASRQGANGSDDFLLSELREMTCFEDTSYKE